MPILVYVVGVDAVTATAYSLFVVGVTSVVGAASYWRRGLVNVRAAAAFSIPSLVVVFLTRSLLVPAIPAQLGTVAGVTVSKELFILVLFAVIMALGAISMIARPRSRLTMSGAATARRRQRSRIRVRDRAPVPGRQRRRCAFRAAPSRPGEHPLAALEGTVIGVLTGVVGAGGGFAIVPALVVFSRLPMRVAVGTSLTIIAAKSLAGLSATSPCKAHRLGACCLPSPPWQWWGFLVGSRVGRHVPGDKLRPAFGCFVLLVAAESWSGTGLRLTAAPPWAATRRLEVQLLGKVACRKMARRHLLPLRCHLLAFILGVQAARMEVAAGRRLGRVGDLTGQDNPIHMRFRVRLRHRRNQRLGVRVLGTAEQVFGFRQFHHLADVHHADAVGDMLDHAQVVGNEQVGEVEFPLQILQQG